MSVNTLDKVLLVEEETTYNTDPSPSASTNAVECRNLKVNYLGDVIERDTHRGNISGVAPRVGKRWIEVTFEVDLMGSGQLGVAPEFGDLLEACAYAETFGGTNGSSIIYTPGSTGIKSVTMYVYEPFSTSNSRLHKITGARGDVNLIMDAGQMARYEFTLRGLYNVPTDVSSVSPTYVSVVQSIQPPIVESAGFTFNATSGLVVQNVTINNGNELVDVDDISTANALKEVRIVRRRMNGSFNPEAVSVATYDWWSDWTSSTNRALALQVGSENYNKCAISAPYCTIDALNDGDLNGARTEDIPFKINQSSGNDEITYTFS